MDDLLELFAFYTEQTDTHALSVEQGVWKTDLFDPDTLLELGVDTGSAAAKGAAIGLTIDVFTGGLSLGAAALVGAGLGILAKHSRALADSVRGYKTYKADLNTLLAIALRQTSLVHTLSQRGHASQHPIQLERVKNELIEQKLHTTIKPAQRHPQWSSLNKRFSLDSQAPQRHECEQAVQAILLTAWQVDIPPHTPAIDATPKTP